MRLAATWRILRRMKLSRIALPFVSASLALGCSSGDASTGRAADAAPSATDAPSSANDAPGAAVDTATSDDGAALGDTGAPPDDVQAPPTDAVVTGDTSGPGPFPADCGDVPLNGVVAGLSARCVGTGETVVLLGGFPEGAAGMAPLASSVATLGHRAITLDLPGWGDSPAGANASAASLSDAVAGALTALGGSPTLVAHDVGAVVAWDLGARHPEATRSVVALSTPPGHLTLPLPAAYAGFADVGAAEALSLDDYAALRALVGDVDPALEAELVASWSAPGALDRMLAFFRDNPSLAANASQVPTLAVWGMADAVFTPQTMTALRGSAKTLDLRVLPGAGHTLHRSAVAEVAGLVDDVMRGATPRESLPLPTGLFGEAPKSPAPIPAMTAVVDEKGTPVTAEELASQTTVLWFYPLASSFG